MKTQTTPTPKGAYANTPHKTIEQLAKIAACRVSNGEAQCLVIQDLVDGYSLGWQSANHGIIERATMNVPTPTPTHFAQYRAGKRLFFGVLPDDPALHADYLNSSDRRPAWLLADGSATEVPPAPKPALSKYRTQIEDDFGHAFDAEEWAAIDGMDAIAKKLMRHCIETINGETEPLSSRPMLYKAQWTLEKLIAKLQACV